MGITYFGFVFWLLALLALRSGAYWAVFRMRTIEVTASNCLKIGAIPLLIGFIPIPWPPFVPILLSTGLAVLVTMLAADVSLIPDGLFIPLGVEAAYQAVLLGFSLHSIF